MLSCTTSFAQQPAYFLIGEEQFSGVQIYDVIQNKDLNYLIATNEGMYYFDYYSYEKIECDEAKSSSVYNLVSDGKGIIYCNNLNGQIFQISEKKCSLFYELEKNEESADISLSVADDGNLVVGAGKIIVLDKNRQVILRYDGRKRYIGQSGVTKDKRVLLHFSGSDTVFVYSKGAYKNHRIILPPLVSKIGVLQFFKLQGVQYAFDQKSKDLYKFDVDKFELTQVPYVPSFMRKLSTRVYETEDGLWVAGTFPGVFLIDALSTSDQAIFYEDFFISDIYKDREGNTLLSTFDKGILVIPDLEVADVIHSFSDDPITSLLADSSMGLMLGSSKGKLLTYKNGDLKIIKEDGKRPIEGMYGTPNSDLILFDDGYIRAYNKRTGEVLDIFLSSLKDAIFVSGNEFYLGTNVGIKKVVWDGRKDFLIEGIEGLDFRVYSLAFNAHEKYLYAATSNGLFAVNIHGGFDKVLYDNKDIYARRIYYSDKKIYAYGNKSKILVIENKHVAHVIIPKVNEKSEELRKIIIRDHSIFAKSANGLFQFDMHGNLVQSIHSSLGFSGRRIIDFTFHQNALWVSHSGGIQKIDLDKGSAVKQPIIQLSQVNVNDQLQPIEPLGNYNSDQRKIQFVFSSPTLRNRETIRYFFKLQGYDADWHINNYELNQVTYNALDPGDYTFEVKAENQGVFSDSSTYSFSIAQPFYARWWFILSAILVFLSLVYVVYRWQLNIQQKKSEQINELNASKLTAIQSQMNPHFIFNSLNSIQDLILKGDVENSYSYITTFSNLVRRTLSYSDKDFIDFDEEIKLLEIYLSLEKLRFKKNLNYTIQTNGIEDVMIPPLLIQPFIENALLHGLLHKEGEKNLTIHFELQESLICTIEDNGIGREKAKVIKQRQRSEHESFSGKAIKKRFEILTNIIDGDFGYTYEDLYQNGIAVGTKVILVIPIKRNF